MRIEGIADLPLHVGHVPPWIAKIMKKLAKAITELVVLNYGTEGLLRRLANPLWFQAFSNAIGMDWDSSGSTTVTTAILKEALNELNIDIKLAGGKGLLARRTPDEIERYSEELNISTKEVYELKKYSTISAKVDEALLQDYFSLYHHTIIFDKNGRWVVIQQGMNSELGLARRYHIAWYVTKDPTVEPHTGVVSDHRGEYLNLTDRESLDSRKVIIDLINEGTRKVKKYLSQVNAYLKGLRPLFGERPPRKIDKSLLYYRPVNLSSKLLRVLENAYEVKPKDMNEVLLYTNIGPETLRALSLIAELIFREPPSLNDPVTTPYSPFKYAFTIGGKDGIPYPIKRDVALSVIRELEGIIRDSKAGSKEKLLALRSLMRLAPKDLLSI